MSDQSSNVEGFADAVNFVRTATEGPFAGQRVLRIEMIAADFSIEHILEVASRAKKIQDIAGEDIQGIDNLSFTISGVDIEDGRVVRTSLDIDELAFYQRAAIEKQYPVGRFVSGSDASLITPVQEL